MNNPPPTAQQEREAKPCHRCLGVEMTWANADDFHICDKHMAEFFYTFSETFERGDHLQEGKP